MKQYLDLCNHILKNGRVRKDRTGTGTISVFGHEMRFNLQEGFPLVTTKKVHFKSIVHELLWFLKGSTSNIELNEVGVSIWDEWALTEEDVVNSSEYVVGDLGPIYGKQWRSWADGGGVVVDQIAALIDNLKTKPFSRRHIVSAWNVADLPDEAFSPKENVKMGKMALAPCHLLFQFYVTILTAEESAEHWAKLDPAQQAALGNPPQYGLSCKFTMRTLDTVLGCPYNVASYALLTSMIAQVCGMVPLELIHSTGDAHIYLNHLDKFKNEQADRVPYPLPKLRLNPGIRNIDDFKFSDIVLEDYVSHPAISYPISV